MRGTLGLKPIQAISTESYVSMSDHLDQLELQLLGSAGAWICGKQFTLADIGMMAILERLREGNWLDLLVEPRPNVSRYWAALKTRNSYQKGCRGFVHPLVFKSTKR